MGVKEKVIKSQKKREKESVAPLAKVMLVFFSDFFKTISNASEKFCFSSFDIFKRSFFTVAATDFSE